MFKENKTAIRLHQYAKYGNLEGIKSLVYSSNANINQGDENGNTALIWTAKNGHLEVVNTLIANGANIDHTNSSGATALIKADENGHYQIVTALTLTAKNNNKEITNLMKEKIYENFEKQQLQINSEKKYSLTQKFMKDDGMATLFRTIFW